MAGAAARSPGADGGRSLAVIVEVQLRRDRRKHLSWPTYLATARARHGCPTMLLVICPKTGVADWARRPIPLGHPGLVLTPLVLGPEEVPVLIDQEKEPELAVVSAVVHGAGPDAAKVLTAMVERVERVEKTDDEQAKSYIDEVLAVLPETARDLLEAILKTRPREYKSDFARSYYGQGKAEGIAEGEARGEARGEAKAVLGFLSARGFEVPDWARVRISECADLEQLGVWVRRAATVGSVEELFEG